MSFHVERFRGLSYAAHMENVRCTPLFTLLLAAALLGCTKKEDALLTKAEQGDAKAQYELGTLYDVGIGVPQDDVEAAKWFLKAAEQGEAWAQFKLGMMHANGRGVVKDEIDAVKWHLKAAEQGLVQAQFSLGVMYANDQGVLEDHDEAVMWYRKAAEQGYAKATGMQVPSELGYRKTAEQGYIEVVQWFRQAAEKGDAAAQFNLGIMYDQGRGMLQEKTEALK